MKEDRDLDKVTTLLPIKGDRKGVSRDIVKSAYIAEGLSVDEIVTRYKLPKSMVERIIKDHKLPELRKAYIQQGIAKIQNVQLDQAKKLLDLENQFKSLRIVQLQELMEEYAAYYSRFGDLKKRHPITGEILKNDQGIALTIRIPNVSKEIRDLKEAVTVSAGMHQILERLESIVNAGDPVHDDEEPDVIDVSEYESLFERDDT